MVADLNFATRTLGNASVFAAAEYAKDGLIAVSEYLGRTPWFYRMVDLIADAMAAEGRFPLPLCLCPFTPIGNGSSSGIIGRTPSCISGANPRGRQSRQPIGGEWTILTAFIDDTQIPVKISSIQAPPSCTIAPNGTIAQ